MTKNLAAACVLLLVAADPHVEPGALMDTVRALAAPAMEGRRNGTPGGLKAREWVRDRFARSGLPPATGKSYELPFRYSTKSGQSVDGVNLAATCKGARPNSPAFVVSAHYDHLGTRDGQVFHGADDNASGVAVLLELMRICRERPFQHEIVFVSFDAEEEGLQGAKAFVASPPIARERIALNVNLDMVARGDKGELYAAGTHHTPSLKPLLEEVARRAPIKLLFGHDVPGTGTDDWTLQSDHGPFHEAGIPFVYFGVEDHPDYHKPSDTPEKIDVKFFGNAANTILDVVRTIDQRRGN